MNEALKKETPTNDEIDLPEHLGNVVDGLKKQQQSIKKEIADAKAQSAVRKQDESTKVFNIRQHQMELKIAELEDKKQKSEKELQAILQQKNSSLHSDLRKLAQFILQETRKITPQIKDLDTKVSSVVHLRNELQHLFDSNLSDRKKNMQYIEDLITTTHYLKEQVKDTSKLLQNDFHFLTKDLEKIQQEKQVESDRLERLKHEITHHHTLLEEIDHKKIELRELENKIATAQKTASTFTRMDEELGSLKSHILKLKEEKETLEASAIRSRQEELHYQEELSRLKIQEKNLDQVLSLKKDQLQKLDEDILDIRKRIEMKKNDEHEIHTKFIQSRDHFNHLQTEISRMEGARVSNQKMLDETSELFIYKKEFFQRELETLKNLYDSKNAELESKFQSKKLQFDEDFRLYSENQKAELKSELESIGKEDLEEIRKKKRDLLNDVVRIMSIILSADGFTSSEEKSQKARKEIEKSFELVFGKTRRWKFW
jgi:chromosome segregation ATPase